MEGLLVDAAAATEWRGGGRKRSRFRSKIIKMRRFAVHMTVVKLAIDNSSSTCLSPRPASWGNISIGLSNRPE